MFESTSGSGQLAALTSDQLAAAVESNFTALLAAENQNLLLAAAWADVHTVDEDAPYGPLVERATILGGAGTPPVAEFCCAEFGALTGTGMIAAQHLIGDALDARQRLPLLWERIQHGQIRAWKARKIAAATRHLSWDACADVDHAIHGYAETLPWPRFEKVMAAAIVDTDPELAAEREMHGVAAGAIHELGHVGGHRLAHTPAKSLVLGGQARICGEPITSPTAEARKVALGPNAALLFGILLAGLAGTATSPVGTAATLVIMVAADNLVIPVPRRSDGGRLFRYLRSQLKLAGTLSSTQAAESGDEPGT